jgi:hypothetical protein
MPTKSEPIWHYRRRGYREIKETPLFTDTIVRNLAIKYGYPNPDDFQVLKETLERAAAIYWFWTNYRENAPRLAAATVCLCECAFMQILNTPA